MLGQIFKNSGRIFTPLKILLPHKLMGRGMLIIFLPLILTEMVAAWAFYDRHFEIVTKRLVRAISGEINFLLDLSTQNLWESGNRDLADLSKSYFNFDFTVDKINEQQEKSFANTLESNDYFTQRLAGALKESAREIKISEKQGEITVQLIQNNLLYTIKFDRKRLFSDTFYVVMAWFILASVFSFGIAALFLKNQIRPILRLARAAEAFGQGQELENFKPEGATEVRLAGRAFIRMRRRIYENLAQRTTLLAGISHDLRTPLTRMKLRVTMLDTPHKDSKDALLADISQMQSMITGYLDFVQQNNQEPASRFDLRTLLDELAQDLQHKGQWTLRCELQGGAQESCVDCSAPLYARKLAVKRALQNVLVNALQYKKSRVAVCLQQGSNFWRIVIDDDGVGIAPSQRQRVFEAFTRLDAARNPQVGGVGLGLTIARDLLVSQGSKIALDSAPLGGLRVIIELTNFVNPEQD